MRTMKDSGIEWIGQIPESWSVEALKRNVKIEMGQSPASECYNSDGVGFPFLQGNADFTDKFPVERMYTSAANKFSKTGDLLLSVRAPVGAVNIADKEYAIGRGLCAITGGRISIPFLWYAIAVLNHEFDANSTGSTFESINTEDVGNAKIMVPGEDEQRRIAEYLDVKCAEIDALIAAKEKTNALLKERRQSIIYEAVTKGLNPDAPMKDSGVEWIGEIPEHWSVGKTIYGLEMPITDGPHETPQLYSDGVPFVSAEAVSCGNGKIDFDHIRGYISEEYYDECCKKYIPQINDIYMIKSGATTGKVAIVDTERKFTIWSPLAVFRCAESKCHYKYLFYFLQSNAYQKQLEAKWSFGTQQNIGMRTLERLIVCFPGINEQKSIAEYLDTCCNETDHMISVNEATIQKLKEYRQSIIYEAVTGKIEI